MPRTPRSLHRWSWSRPHGFQHHVFRRSRDRHGGKRPITQPSPRLVTALLGQVHHGRVLSPSTRRRAAEFPVALPRDASTVRGSRAAEGGGATLSMAVSLDRHFLIREIKRRAHHDGGCLGAGRMTSACRGVYLGSRLVHRRVLDAKSRRFLPRDPRAGMRQVRWISWMSALRKRVAHGAANHPVYCRPVSAGAGRSGWIAAPAARFGDPLWPHR